jgi:hypothetical protein
MSKILLYNEPITGVTTNGDSQHAFFINENGLPTVKNGSQVITFGTTGYAFAGSSGSSGVNGSAGVNGTAGSSGESGATGASGSSGSSGATGSSGSSGANGFDGATGPAGSSGASGSAGTSGQTFGTSGVSGTAGSSGSSGAPGSSGSSGAQGATGTSGSSGQEGLGNYVATTTANITRSSNNTFTKTSGGNSWNAGFYSSQQGFRSAYIAGSPSSTTGLGLLGMSTGTIVTSDPAFIDYGLGVYSGSTNIVAIESGTVVYTHSSAPTASTRYLINYDLQNVRYYIDGLLVHTTARTEFGLLFLDAAIFTQGAGFTGVVIGSAGTVGPSGSTGAAGTSGSSGANGSSGTSAAGGGSTIFLSDFGGALLDDTQTNQYGFKYLYGVYGNGNHWGYDDIRNYEYGQTIPAIVPVGKKIKTVYFPIQCEIAEEDIDFKFVVWSKKAGTFYPYYYLGHVDHTFNFETTGYKVIAFDLNFENDGTLTGVTDDTLFLSVVSNDVNMAMKFRKSVIYYDDTLKGGIFNPTTGDFAANQLWGANRVFNSSWFGEDGIPGIYGPGPGNGYTQGETWIPMFYSIADI